MSKPVALPSYALITPKLSQVNWYTWRCRVLDVLAMLGMSGVTNGHDLAEAEASDTTTGTEDAPVPTRATSTTGPFTSVQLSTALFVLRINVSDDLLHVVRDATTPSDAWRALTTMFEVKTSSQVLALKLLLHSTKLAKGLVCHADVKLHIDTIDDISMKLRTAGKAPSDTELAELLANSVSYEDWRHLIRSYDYRPGGLTLQALRSDLLEESIRNSTELSLAASSRAVALSTATNVPRPKYHCDHCSMTGHTKDRCYKLNGYPPGYQHVKRPRQVAAAAAAAVAAASPVSATTPSLPIPLNQPKVTASMFGAFAATSGTVSPSVPDVTSVNAQAVALASLVEDQPIQRFALKWHLDSAASMHYSSTNKGIVGYMRFDTPVPIILGNGTSVSAVGFGSMPLPVSSATDSRLSAMLGTCHTRGSVKH